MTVLVICSYSQFMCDTTLGVLGQLGLSKSVNTERHNYSAEHIIDKMTISYGDDESPLSFHQKQPGETWRVLAADLFSANADHRSWGWASPNNIWWLDYWNNFDPNVRFLFVFSTPREDLAHRFAAREADVSALDFEMPRWLSYHHEALRFLNANPDRAKLIGYSTVIDEPEAVAELCHRDFGLTLHPDPMDNDPATGAATTPHMRDDFPLLDLLLSQSLTTNDAMDETELQLRNAASLRHQPGALVHPDLLDSAWREYFDWKSPAKKQYSTPESNDDEFSPQTFDAALAQLKISTLQSELKYYFRLYHNAISNSHNETALPTTNATNRSPRRMNETPANAIIVDLRGVIDGDNWYSPETQGRWAGPAQCSSVRIPNIEAGHYKIYIDIVDAIDDDIIKNFQLLVDDKVINLRSVIQHDMDGSFVWARRLKSKLRQHRPYPIRFFGVCKIQSDDATRDIQLALKFPYTKSPASRGDNDGRELTACLSQITLERVDRY